MAIICSGCHDDRWSADLLVTGLLVYFERGLTCFRRKNVFATYRIRSNKRCGAYFVQRPVGAALISFWRNLLHVGILIHEYFSLGLIHNTYSTECSPH